MYNFKISDGHIVESKKTGEINLNTFYLTLYIQDIIIQYVIKDFINNFLHALTSRI